jgi:multidrug efflux pump
MLADYLRNGRFLLLSIALLIVAGLAALSTLPRTEDPHVLNRLAVVLTAYPGATSERVEALVSEPIENQLRKMPEIDDIWSTSRPGLSVVSMRLKDEVTATDEVWSRARDYLADAQIEMPEGALPSRFDDDRGHAYTIQYALVWDGDSEASLPILRRYAKELKTRLRGVAGTDLVRTFGEPDEEVLVAIDQRRLASLQMTSDMVAAAVRDSDSKVAAGELHNDRNQLQIEVAGGLDSLERIREIPLRVNRSGETVHVGDVASVSRAVADPPNEIVLIDGKPGIVVAVRMLPNLRIDHWMVRINRVVDEFSKLSSANVRVQAIFDQSQYTDDRLGSLALNVVMGFVIILAVLLVTLGVRAAIIVALALPLTALFTLACMKYWGLPIHQMSVTGLVVALGIMVDNAIVMVDTIQQKREQGSRALTAVVDSIRHLWLPLLGSTLTTILAFAPIALMPGPAGEFVGGIALSVMFSLVGSYLISHTIIAGLGGRFLRACPERDRGWLSTGLEIKSLGRGFRSLLRWCLLHPVRSIAVTMLLPALGFLSSTWMTEQFFPPSDRDMFRIQLTLPQQSSISATRQIVERVQQRLQEQPEIQNQHWFIGNNAPSFYYNMMGGQDGAAEFAEGMILASSFAAANRLIPTLQLELDDAFPEARILVRKLEQGPPFNAPLEVRLYGPSLERLARLGQEIRLLMSETTNVMHTRATLVDAQPKVRVTAREEVAYQSGLQLTEVARQLQASLNGSVAGSILEGTEELPVRVRVNNAERGQLSDLSSLYLATELSSGRDDEINALPLSAIASLDIKPARGVIPRRNGQRVNTIEGYIRAGVLPETALIQFREQLLESGFVMPAGYQMEFGGESSERNEAVGNLMASVGVIATLLVLVVVLTFNSFRISGIIFAVATQAAGLGILSVFVFGYPFGFTVIVGLLGLIGLAINASIVILAELKANPKAVRGDVDAVVDGVMSCTRHITSTTITTVGGFLPLMLSGGGFWPPFAIAIAGGTVLTTMLSFIFAPAVFLLFARRRAFDLSKQSEPAAVRLLPARARVEESTAAA